MTEKSGQNQAGRFQRGMSGNPRGKPKGARARVTQLAEKLLEDDRDDIVRAVIAAAKGGDSTAMRLCIERLIPVRKGRPVVFDLPAIETPADVVNALGTIAGAMAGGELTPDEANAVAGVIEFRRRAIETVEHEERLRKLEERYPGGDAS
jgi:Family of unknown function (DUF5681)